MDSLNKYIALSVLDDDEAILAVTDFERRYYEPNADLTDLLRVDGSGRNINTIEIVNDKLSRNKNSGYLFTHYFNQTYLDSANESSVGSKIIILGYIYTLSQPYPMTITDDQGSDIRVSVCDISLKDNAGSTVDCLPVPASDMGDLSKYQASKNLFLFEGTILSEIDPRGFYRRYRFYIRKIHDNVNPLHLVNAKDEEMARVENILLDLYLKNIPIRQYIKKTLVNNMGIKGLGSARELDKAIDFMIVQSFSRGLSGDGRYSNKLHSLVIGSPAVGKKLLTMIARILNPISFELASASAKVTPAGLVGNVVREKNVSKSNPGYFSLASDGIVCIQDFHEISKDTQALSGIFSMVMEDGKVIDSTSAKTEHKAVTSIHLDMNKLSQVTPDKEYNVYNDLNIPMNLISRFDFIIDIPPNLSRQYEVVLEMAGGHKLLQTAKSRNETPQWQRDLQIIVALQTTYFTTAFISNRLSSTIKDRFTRLIEANKEHSAVQRHFPGMLTRLYNSLEKYVKALACADTSIMFSDFSDFYEAEKRHVAEAFDFILSKLDFLSKLEPMSIPDLGYSSKISPKEIIYENFKGKETSIKNICKEYNSKVQTKISERTIRRYVEELKKEGKAFKSRKGFWNFQNLTDDIPSE